MYTPEDVPELYQLQQGASFCARGMWGMEVLIHDYFSQSPHRTFDPEEATWFLVSTYGICLFEGNVFKIDKVDALYIDLVTKLPFFNRTGGRDHVFTFASGMSVDLWTSWRDYIPNSVINDHALSISFQWQFLSL